MDKPRHQQGEALPGMFPKNLLVLILHFVSHSDYGVLIYQFSFSRDDEEMLF